MDEAQLSEQLRHKLRDMEGLLQMQWDDLDPDRVGLMIEIATCEICSPSA